MATMACTGAIEDFARIFYTARAPICLCMTAENYTLLPNCAADIQFNFTRCIQMGTTTAGMIILISTVIAIASRTTAVIAIRPTPLMVLRKERRMTTGHTLQVTDSTTTSTRMDNGTVVSFRGFHPRLDCMS